MTVSYIRLDICVLTYIDILEGECTDVDRPCSMCFCYRSCEEGQGETGSQAEEAEAPELVLGRLAPLRSGADI